MLLTNGVLKVPLGLGKDYFLVSSAGSSHKAISLDIWQTLGRDVLGYHELRGRGTQGKGGHLSPLPWIGGTTFVKGLGTSHWASAEFLHYSEHCGAARVGVPYRLLQAAMPRWLRAPCCAACGCFTVQGCAYSSPGPRAAVAAQSGATAKPPCIY